MELGAAGARRLALKKQGEVGQDAGKQRAWIAEKPGAGQQSAEEPLGSTSARRALGWG